MLPIIPCLLLCYKSLWLALLCSRFLHASIHSQDCPAILLLAGCFCKAPADLTTLHSGTNTESYWNMENLAELVHHQERSGLGLYKSKRTLRLSRKLGTFLVCLSPHLSSTSKCKASSGSECCSSNHCHSNENSGQSQIIYLNL